MVISYAYLWRHEHNRGQEEGRKNRPCVIVLSVTQGESKTPLVTVAAITHSQPGQGSTALEVPQKVKDHLGLDMDRSWIILDEVNQFNWPGYDIRPRPGKNGNPVYGFIPPKLFDAAKKLLLATARERKLTFVSRD